MMFIDFLKAREGKNKYGMLSQNFNRRTNVAMEHNGEIAALKKANANLKQENIELRRRNNLLEKQLQDSFIKNGLLI